jgi:hypothetical protein
MPLMINYVWFGNGTLGWMEKFNVYSWRALGHNVTIYACRWDDNAPDVGVKEKNVTTVNLRTILGTLDQPGPDDQNKAAILPKTRELLKAWLAAAGGAVPEQDSRYNLIDVAKSYIGGTRQGIVMDLKVGPSPHISAYVDVFSTRFISYSRGAPGSNTADGSPENQCMGTMQAGETLRGKYAKVFESSIAKNFEVVEEAGNKTKRTGMKPQFDHKWFDTITGYHIRACTLGTNFLDVSRRTPTDQVIKDIKGKTEQRYEVEEIGGKSNGPFRVFKRADDQSNKGGKKTTPEEQKDLARKVWNTELNPERTVNLNIHPFTDPYFLKKLPKLL